MPAVHTPRPQIHAVPGAYLPSNADTHEARGRSRLSKFLLFATAVATYQIYFLPVLGTFFPISIFLIWACVPYINKLPEDRSVWIASVIYVVSIVLSIGWSSDFGAWANAVVYGFIYFIAFFAARSVADQAAMERILKTFVYFAAINAILVIVFRFLPSIEAVFLNSGAINLFKNPKRVANLVAFKPNVLDPLKAGGVFDNANTGAAFSLLCVGATLSVFDKINRTLRWFLLILFIVAVGASGSKSAVIILVGGFALCTLFTLSAIKDPFLRVAIVCFGFAAGVAGIWGIEWLHSAATGSEFGQQTAQTSTYRALLLQIAAKAFFQHPILGLGFGGWGKIMEQYAFLFGVEDYWPPHNGIVLAWTESGVVGAVALVSACLIAMARLVKGMTKSDSRLRATGAFFALFCTFVMSLGDTFPLIGSQNAAVPLGVVVAWGLFSANRDSSR